MMCPVCGHVCPANHCLRQPPDFMRWDDDENMTDDLEDILVGTAA